MIDIVRYIIGAPAVELQGFSANGKFLRAGGIALRAVGGRVAYAIYVR